MYTQCPDCRTTFRVAADDLRQAAGKVRCGDCGTAFDALLYLSEDMPQPDTSAATDPVLPELKHESKVDGPKLPESISANESIALLQTLDELAGSDVRIEDTGIEWRVLDEVAMSELGTDEAPSDDQPDPDTEVRYDDDSPLPDELANDEDGTPENEPDSAAEDAADDSEQEPVADDSETEPVADESEPELIADDIDVDEIDDSGDWEAILEDIEEPAAESTGDKEVEDEELIESEDEAVPDGDDTPADESPEASQEEASESHDEGADDASDESQDESQDKIVDDESIDEVREESHDENGDDEVDDDEVDGKPVDEAQDDSDDEAEIALEDGAADDAAVVVGEAAAQTAESHDEDSSPSQWQLLDEDEQDDSIPTLTEPQEPAAGQDMPGQFDEDDFADAAEDFGVESIVLEGDSVSVALEDTEAAASLLAAADASDFSATVASPPPPSRSASRRGGLVVVILLLLVALGVQAIHQQRQTLAKIPAINSIIGPLYRTVGKPLAPAWDVTGWSFEATTGKAEDDDEQLNVYTRIGNRSYEALPYPLIGVSLTDRYEEIIGSRVVEPSGYLPSNVNPRKLVAPGETFEAFIAVQSPEMIASGYKLDVCYRLPDRRLRCAIGDFR